MLSKARIKYIQSLYQKKFRDESEYFVIEGPKIVSEFIQSVPQQIENIYSLHEWLHQEDSNLRLVNPASIAEIDESTLKSISNQMAPNQVLAIVKKWEQNSQFDFENSLGLILDGIRDPGNLGTIIRIADWFGVNSILCSEDCVELYNPKVIQSTMGSILRVKVAYENLDSWIETNENVKIYATAMDGKPIYEFKAVKEGAIVIGNEATGIRDSVIKKAHEIITIPSVGKAQSLNAAVATGIILSHFVS